MALSNLTIASALNSCIFGGEDRRSTTIQMLSGTLRSVWRRSISTVSLPARTAERGSRLRGRSATFLLSAKRDAFPLGVEVSAHFELSGKRASFSGADIIGLRERLERSRVDA